MKKNIAFLALGLMLMAGHSSFSQAVFGLKGGVNFANIGGDAQGVSSKTGFHAGVLVHAKTSDKFAIQTELVYSQQGASGGGVNINYAYMNVPVIMKAFIEDGFNFQFGPQIGILTSAKVGDFDVKDQLNDTDISFALGLGYETSSNVIIDFRYNLGVTSTAKDDTDGTFPNKVFQISIGVKLP